MTTEVLGATTMAACVALLLMSVRSGGVSIGWSDPDAALHAELGSSRLSGGLGAWWTGIRCAAGILGASLGFAFGASPVVTAMLALLLPSVWLRLRIAGARERARSATVELVGAIHGAVRSGLPLAEAIRRALSGCADPLAARPFERALHAFTLGTSLDAALGEGAQRTKDARLRSALETLAIGVAERLPLDRVAALLGEIVDRLTFDLRLDDEVRARSTGMRAQAWLLAGVIPLLAGYLALTVPTLNAALAMPLARVVLLPAAVMLELAGLVLTQRIVRSALR